MSGYTKVKAYIAAVPTLSPVVDPLPVIHLRSGTRTLFFKNSFELPSQLANQGWVIMTCTVSAKTWRL